MAKQRRTVTKACIGCGTTFDTSDSRRTRCKKNCGRSQQGRVRSSESNHGARTARRAAHIVEFIGVDGEGVTYCQHCHQVKTASICPKCNTSDWHHDYVLLSVGDQSLSNPDGSRLTWVQIVHFLWEQFCEHHDAAFIGFFLGYDFTQWLRTLPEKRAFSLLHHEGIEKRQRRQENPNPVPFPVRLYEPDTPLVWEIDILGDKRLKLRLRDAEDPNPWMFICDTGPFWQCSFLSAINPTKWNVPVVTTNEYDTIVEGKARRDVAQLDADMMRYNVTENKVLARVMGHLNEGLTNAGIRLDRDKWFGPGQAAQAWLDLIGAPLAQEIRAETPLRFRQSAQFAYYGGWFEIMGHGHVPGITYEYDINSAYPAVIAELPCLLHGKWTEGNTSRTKDLPPRGLRLVHATIQGDNLVTGAMPWRNHKGKILRPNRLSGWYWWHELVAARDAGLIRPGHRGEVAGIKVDEWMQFEPTCDCPPPIGAIRELYERRIHPDVGKNSPEGIALKLVYNSSYGKFAQSIGSPKYSNAVYASLITAGCRTQILQAIATHPTKTDSLVMVATDGVYFREPHPHLDLTKNKLGAWEEQEKQNLTLMMPGVYWDDKLRKALNEGGDKLPRFKSRGISAKDLAGEIDNLDRQWTRFRDVTSDMHPQAEIGPDPWPTLELSVSFAMISAKQAITRGKWDTAGDVSTTSRQITSHPDLKRCVTEGRDLTNDNGMMRSLPWRSNPENVYILETTPYDQQFGEELREQREEHPLSDDANSIYDPFGWIWRDQ